MALDLATGSAKAALKLRKDDLYETPEVATRALLKVETLPRRVWEPACGRGAIVRVLRQAGHDVVATDLVDWGCPDSEARHDFLMHTSSAASRILAGAIITNPPFKLAGEFAAHALQMVPKVVMLCRLAFLESERRSDVLDGGKLARVHIFRNRLPMMHREGYEGQRTESSAMAFAWFVWDRDHKGPTELHRISWTAE